MPDNAISEFSIDIVPTGPAPRPTRDAREDRMLGLRTKLEFFYSEMKGQQQRKEEDLAEEEKKEVQRLLDLIDIADSFEDVFRMCDKDKKMRRQTQVRKQFATTYDTFLELLENNNVFRVDIKGTQYDDVVFRGVTIPEPWMVVETDKANGKRVVRKVLRSLWVRVVHNRLQVLRRAQVSY